MFRLVRGQSITVDFPPGNRHMHKNLSRLNCQESLIICDQVKVFLYIRKDTSMSRSLSFARTSRCVDDPIGSFEQLRDHKDLMEELRNLSLIPQWAKLSEN